MEEYDVQEAVRDALSTYNDYATSVSFETDGYYPIASVWDDSDEPKIIQRVQVEITLRILPTKE